MSEMGFTVFNTVINIVEMFLMAGFVTQYLGFRIEVKHKLRAFLITWLILFLQIQIMNSITLFEGIMVFLNPIILTVYAVVCLKGKWIEKIFVSIIPLMCTALISSLAAGLMTLIWKEHINEMIINRRYEYIGMVILTKVLLIMFFLMILMLKKKIKELPENKLWFLFVLILFTSIISVFFIYLTLTGGCKDIQYVYYLIISVIGIVIMNFITFYFLKRIGKETELKQEIELLRQNTYYQQENIRNIVQEQERVKKIRHDMKNVILAIEGLAKQEESEKIKSYCVNYRGTIGTENNAIYTGINTVDNVLAHKFGIAESQGNRVKVEITRFEQSHVEDMHLCIILGNLLDNAIEALQKVTNKDKYLFISIEQENDSYISIYIKNAIDTSVLENNPEFTTTKSEKEIHGFGVRNVRELVKQYKGIINFYEEGKVFVCQIKI